MADTDTNPPSKKRRVDTKDIPKLLIPMKLDASGRKAFAYEHFKKWNKTTSVPNDDGKTIPYCRFSSMKRSY